MNKNTSQFRDGYQWAKDEIENKTSLEDIEAKIGTGGMADFDWGAVEFLREHENNIGE